MFTPKLTHKDLVEIAYKWVLNNANCGVAFKELVSANSEIPDVIGFSSGESVLVECKVSRQDFLKDKNKRHRVEGMGNWRFFICPTGLIKKEELPGKWGLICVDGKGKCNLEYDCRKKQLKQSCETSWMLEKYPEGFYMRTVTDYDNYFKSDIQAEHRLMYSALRRLAVKGFVKHIYQKDYDSILTEGNN